MIGKKSLIALFASLVLGGVSQAADSADPALPKVRVTASDPIAFRGLSTAGFTIYREETNGPLVVKFALSGSASNKVDYAELPDSVTIPAGFHAVGLEVEPLGDGGNTPNKIVILTLLSNATYNLSRSPNASILIKGNSFENQAPAVEITSPADNSGIPARSDLTIIAKATDPNDSVVKVSFFANDHFLGSDSEAPYSLIWSNVPAGKFALFARAEDVFGKSTVSAAVNIIATNPPPGGGVILIDPANGASFGAGADITVSATPKDSSAVVKSISFFAGDMLLGTVTTAPFSLVWSNVAPGSYYVFAKALEANGAISTSFQSKIIVTNPPPTVTILTPTNNTVLPFPSNVTIEAKAEDADGISSVMFFGGERFLGTVRTAPYSLTWSNVPAGKQTITVRAIDAYGGAKSESVKITVSNTPPTLKLVAPTNNTTLVAPATLELKAEASDPDGVAYVSFWVGDERLGEDRIAPYSLTVPILRTGSYTFSAHAVDKQGQRTVSAPVKVTVTR